MVLQNREPMTPEGHQKLSKEIEHIKTVERPNNIQALEEARGHGDLTENADYEAAKNHQELITSRLVALENRYARAEVIDPKTLSGDAVMFGATVTLINMNTDQQITYKIVGSYEADHKNHTISFDSPMGKAIIGKRQGDEVVVNAPGGSKEFAIVKVEYK